MKVKKAEDNIRELTVALNYQVNEQEKDTQYYRISWSYTDL